jgi:hypothetical protein
MPEVGQRNPPQQDPDYLAWIRTRPCCVCGEDTTVEAHHPRIGVGMAQKASDKWALPLCGRHHREVQAQGDRVFWASLGIDPIALSMHYRVP